VWQRALEAVIDVETPRVVLVGLTVDAMGVAPAVAARKRLGVRQRRYGGVARRRPARGARGLTAAS
jgi:hypothetical protein